MNYATKTVLATALIGFVWAGCGGSPTINGANGPQPAPVFVAVGAKGSIVTSHDGMTWTATASGGSAGLKSIAPRPSIFSAGGAPGARPRPPGRGPPGQGVRAQNNPHRARHLQ